MSNPTSFIHDAERSNRTGLPEAILCAGKSIAQLNAIIATLAKRDEPVLFTRLEAQHYEQLDRSSREQLDFDAESRTAVLGPLPPANQPPRVAVVAAGTSDMPVAREAVRTLACAGEASLELYDVGVAGLWRLLENADSLRPLAVKIVVAGMDGALPTVVAGLVPGVIIGVPCSTGYGAAEGGRTALGAMLSSCAPGLTVTNIDNGYGAAAAAVRALQLVDGSVKAG